MTPPSASPASQGNFELNVFQAPSSFSNYLHSVELLADACNSFVEHCVNGIQANREQIEHYVRNSLMLVTALAPKSATTTPPKSPKPPTTPHQPPRSRPQSWLRHPEEFDALVKPEDMTHP